MANLVEVPRSPTSASVQSYSVISTALQQWVDARAHLSEATQAYINATTFLESICTPLAIKSLPDVWNTVDNNLKVIEREELKLHRTQAALKKKRNSFVSPIYALPSELLATIFTNATTSTSLYESSEGYDKWFLSRVCSRWRQIALDVCPFWEELSLYLESDDISLNRLGHTEIDLGRTNGETIRLYPELSIEKNLYLQAVLDTITPYIKHLSSIYFIIETVEQFQPLLSFWLEKGVSGSLNSLTLVSNRVAPAFPETNSHLNNRMAEYIRHIQVLELFSVGLDWSTVAFDRLESILLQGLPSTCCPNLAQLAQILSTCPTLRTISLERVQMSIPPNTVSPAPVNLEHLESLSLLEVDIPKILSIILPGRKKIDLTLKGFVDNDDTLNTFYRFISRADVQKLTLTLSEVRSDAALSQLLPSAMIFTPELERLALHDMNIRESEINILHDYSFSPNAQLMPPPISTLADLPRIKEIQLHSCIIHSPPEVFCNAIRNLLGNRLLLTDCNHSPTTQGVSGATESLELIDETSDFGMQMAESLPGRVSFSDQ